MPDRRCTPWSPSSRACADGFSAIEVLVALAATGIIAAATLTIALSTRDMFETDRHRTTINQNLRAGMDLLGIDVRQAGERMPWDAPAVRIVNGASGAPDQLVLARNLLDFVLPVCKDVKAGTSADAVFVAKKKGSGKVPPGCAPVLDDNGDGWPDNLEQWHEYRIAHGGQVLAFIWNPVTQLGEFFVYDAEDSSTFHLHKLNGEHWTNDYPVNQNPRIYLLESKTFRLAGDILQALVNGDPTSALNLVSHIEDFQVRALFQDGSAAETLAGQTWTALRSLEVTLVGGSELHERSMERTIVTQFFPRNILSN